MSIVRIPLDEQQEAHLALILDLSKVELGHVLKLKQEAEERQSQRLAPLTKSLGIPDGSAVSVEGRKDDAPCFLVYEQRDVERALKLEYNDLGNPTVNGKEYRPQPAAEIK